MYDVPAIVEYVLKETGIKVNTQTLPHFSPNPLADVNHPVLYSLHGLDIRKEPVQVSVLLLFAAGFARQN